MYTEWIKNAEALRYLEKYIERKVNKYIFIKSRVPMEKHCIMNSESKPPTDLSLTSEKHKNELDTCSGPHRGFPAMG